MSSVDLDQLREVLADLEDMNSYFDRGWEYRLVLAVAQSFLVERETGLKVWWCVEHKSQRVNKIYPHGWRCGQVVANGNWAFDPPCSMVEALLVTEGSE